MKNKKQQQKWQTTCLNIFPEKKYGLIDLWNLGTLYLT